MLRVRGCSQGAGAASRWDSALGASSLAATVPTGVCLPSGFLLQRGVPWVCASLDQTGINGWGLCPGESPHLA